MTCQNLELFANPLPSLDEPRQSFFYSMSQALPMKPSVCACVFFRAHHSRVCSDERDSTELLPRVKQSCQPLQPASYLRFLFQACGWVFVRLGMF